MSQNGVNGIGIQGVQNENNPLKSWNRLVNIQTDSNAASGVAVVPSSVNITNVMIDNLLSQNNTQAGLAISTSGALTTQNITLSNIKLIRNSRSGNWGNIVIEGGQTTVDNVIATNIQAIGDTGMGDNIFITNSSNMTASNIHVTNSLWSGIVLQGSALKNLRLTGLYVAGQGQTGIYINSGNVSISNSQLNSGYSGAYYGLWEDTLSQNNTFLWNEYPGTYKYTGLKTSTIFGSVDNTGVHYWNGTALI